MKEKYSLVIFRKILLFCCLMLLTVTTPGCSSGSENVFLEEKEDEEITAVVKEEETVTSIIVEIKGEVRKPGVYTMPHDARLHDLLLASGGTTSLSNLRNVNLAMKIEDGASFYIPSIHDEEEEPITVGQEEKEGKIDLNKASREELMSVTGIGPATADNILAYREEAGKFNSVDELVNVNRIGEKTLEKIRDYFTVK